MSKRHMALPIKPKTDVAATLLERLPEHVDVQKIRIGKFGVSNETCLAIEIFRSTDAFELGATIGNDYGPVQMSSVGNQKLLVFRDAHISLQGPLWYS